VLQIGQVLHDSYQLTRVLGEGGMGTVYEAVHVRLAKKRFAIKVLHAEVLNLPAVFARFRREAEIATELGHPNIVDVLDFNHTDEGEPYMVMEFLEGEDLAHRLRRTGRLPVSEVIAVMQQVGSGLQAAHDQGIVHRDMKPDNIFLVRQPGGGFQAKVLDFGISKIRHSTSVVTRENAVMGTPQYMSPEQAQGAVGDIDHRTDIFALGAICFQALSGQLPFDAPTLLGVLYQVCNAEPAPIQSLVPELPAPVDAVLRRALAKQISARYSRVDEMVGELLVALGVTSSSRLVLAAMPTRVPREVTGPTQALAATAPDPPAPAAVPVSRAVDPVAAAATVSLRPAAPSSDDPAPEAGKPAKTPTTLSGVAGELEGESRTSRRRGLLVGLGLVGLAALGGLAYVFTRTTPESVGPVASAGSTVALAAPATPATRPAGSSGTAVAAPVEQARIELELAPREAEVFVDGARRTDNPLLLVAGEKSHLLRVTAAGHEPYETQLQARSQHVVVKLSRLMTAKTSPTRSARREPPRAPAGAETAKRPDDWVEPDFVAKRKGAKAAPAAEAKKAEAKKAEAKKAEAKKAEAKKAEAKKADDVKKPGEAKKRSKDPTFDDL